MQIGINCVGSPTISDENPATCGHSEPIIVAFEYKIGDTAMMIGITESEHADILNAVNKAERVAVGFEVDYSDVPDRWMGIFRRVIDVVRDEVAESRREERCTWSQARAPRPSAGSSATAVEPSSSSASAPIPPRDGGTSASRTCAPSAPSRRQSDVCFRFPAVDAQGTRDYDRVLWQCDVCGDFLVEDAQGMHLPPEWTAGRSQWIVRRGMLMEVPVLRCPRCTRMLGGPR